MALAFFLNLENLLTRWVGVFFSKKICEKQKSYNSFMCKSKANTLVTCEKEGFFVRFKPKSISSNVQTIPMSKID